MVKRLLPIFFLVFLPMSLLIGKRFEGYTIVSYSESASGATFTMIRGNEEIKAICGHYYGSNGACDRLKAQVGETIPWPQMMNISSSTLQYNPDNSGTCVKNSDCEYLRITTQQAVR